MSRHLFFSYIFLILAATFVMSPITAMQNSSDTNSWWRLGGATLFGVGAYVFNRFQPSETNPVPRPAFLDDKEEDKNPSHEATRTETSSGESARTEDAPVEDTSVSVSQETISRIINWIRQDFKNTESLALLVNKQAIKDSISSDHYALVDTLYQQFNDMKLEEAQNKANQLLTALGHTTQEVFFEKDDVGLFDDDFEYTAPSYVGSSTEGMEDSERLEAEIPVFGTEDKARIIRLLEVDFKNKGSSKTLEHEDVQTDEKLATNVEASEKVRAFYTALNSNNLRNASTLAKEIMELFSIEVTDWFAAHEANQRRSTPSNSNPGRRSTGRLDTSMFAGLNLTGGLQPRTRLRRPTNNTPNTSDGSPSSDSLSSTPVSSPVGTASTGNHFDMLRKRPARSINRKKGTYGRKDTSKSTIEKKEDDII